MFSWESEEKFVDVYEAAIRAKEEPSVAKCQWSSPFVGLVIAVALHQRDEDSRHKEGWRPIRDDLRTTLRALDALPIIAKNELKQNKHFMTPGLLKLKVSGMRPKLKAFPSRALKAAVLLNGHRSSSSSSETLQLPSPPSPSPPSAPSPRSLAWHCPLACSVARGRKRKAEEE